MSRARGQATLVAFGVALLLVAATVGVALAVADGAFTAATRDPTDARLASSAADRLTASDAPLTRRANVLNESRLTGLSADRVVAIADSLAETAFRVRVGNRTIAQRGQIGEGARSRRLVVVAQTTPRTRQVNASRSVSLPRRTTRVRFGFQNASVETVRAGDRVLLHNASGLTGTVTVATRRLATLRLRFDGSGTVRVRTYPTQTTTRQLVVTVDAG